MAQNRKPKVATVVFPMNAELFAKSWPDFRQFLKSRGSEILSTTNAYEVARFTTPEGTGVIYRNANGAIKANNWQGGAASAYIAWRRSDGDWRVGAKTRNPWPNEKAGLFDALVQRDGLKCFYCLKRLDRETATQEHFVAKTHGGPNHISNMAIACEDCNIEVGHKSVAEKFAYAMRRQAKARAQFAARPVAPAPFGAVTHLVDFWNREVA